MKFEIYMIATVYKKYSFAKVAMVASSSETWLVFFFFFFVFFVLFFKLNHISLQTLCIIIFYKIQRLQ